MLSEKQIAWVREQLGGVKIGELDALAIWMPTIEDLGNTYKDFWGRTRRFVAFARWASETRHPLDGHILSDYADSLSVSESSKAVYLSWIRCILRRCVAVPESACAPRKARRAKKQAEPKKAKESCSLVRVAAVQDTKPKRRNFTKTFLFELFDIKPGFDEHDLKRGYRKAAMQYHPDHGGRAAQFRAVEEAYRWLADTRGGIPGHRGWVYTAYADARYDLEMPEIDAVVKGFYEQICESAAV